VKKGGIQFGVDPDSTYQVVKAIRQETDLTLVTKLTPNVTDITVIAKAAVSAETDAISLINSPLAMVIDIEKRRSRLGRNLTGGISGPAIRPIAVRLVWQVAQAVSIPVIGAGGITCAEDALQFIIAGASAVQIGAYNFVDPTIMIRVIEGIEAYMNRKNIDKLSSLIGSLEI
jgi:dihydroorotate dehydrogenase (NAD+) catalytic subunit